MCHSTHSVYLHDLDERFQLVHVELQVQSVRQPNAHRLGGAAVPLLREVKNKRCKLIQSENKTFRSCGGCRSVWHVVGRMRSLLIGLRGAVRGRPRTLSDLQLVGPLSNPAVL